MPRVFIGVVVGLIIGASVMYFIAQPSKTTAETQPAEPVVKTTPVAKTEVELVYEKSCKVCHPMRPPAGQGPPILGLATHYREAFSDKDKAIAHMVDFMKHPDVSKSKVEARAIKRFGLMPAMPNSEKELKLVAEWLWDQYDPSFECGGGRGRGRRN